MLTKIILQSTKLEGSILTLSIPLSHILQFQAATSIGFFLGVVFVMANQMLILFAIFADRAHHVGLADGVSQLQAQQAMAVFSFFLFVVYGFFGSVLAIFRNEIVKQGKYLLIALTCIY